MNSNEYEELVEAARDGSIMVGIDRQAARQLFTDMSLDQIKSTTGRSPGLSKAIAVFCFVGAPLLVLIGGIFSFKSIGWWAIAVAPVAIITWLFYKSISVRGNAGLGMISIAAAILIWGAFESNTQQLYLAGAFIAVGLWMERFLYVFATWRMRELVLNSKEAFEAFRRAIVIRRT